MAASILTKRTIDSLTKREKTYVAYDSNLSGFGCRVTPKGAKSWIVEYRPHGGGRRVAKRRITLGTVSTLAPNSARSAAKDILARVRLGEDVADEKAARRVAPTIKELSEKYMREEVLPMRKPATAAHYKSCFRLHVVPELGSKRARDVTRAEIERLHRKIGAKHPVVANRMLMLLSGMYSWAEKVCEVPANTQPARRISRYREEGRGRYLSTEELGRLGEALREAETIGLPWDVDETKTTAKHAPKLENRREKVSAYAVAAIRLLLFTGCRLREILNLRWEEVDFELGMLFLRDSKTGRKPVILAAPALAVLSELPRIGLCVVPGNDPDRPRHDLQRPWGSISKKAGLAGVRLHDLRHSFAATGAASGMGLPIIGKLLGHRNPETTARYAHVGADPLKAAANRIANQLATAMNAGTKQEDLDIFART